jgi:hypothetical protein
MPEPVEIVRIFVASSTPNVKVARTFARVLQNRGFRARVWDEWVFWPNESTFDGLLRISTEYNFAVIIWGPSDITTTGGKSISSPRDNVIFEAGLFLGVLGRHRVFIAEDKTAATKIPSDYAGITRVTYEGSLIQHDSDSAVRSACDQIQHNIDAPHIPANLSVLAGEWKSRYAAGPDKHHREVIDNVVIRVEPDGISFVSDSMHGLVPYSGQGKVYRKDQIIGRWNHPTNRSMAEGFFMLTVSPVADVMYGYSTSQDENGAIIYGTWAFAKKDGRSEQEIHANLLRAQETLRQRTISPRTRKT